MIIWSTQRTCRISAADFIFSVISLSAVLGEGSPLGWLWTRTKPSIIFTQGKTVWVYSERDIMSIMNGMVQDIHTPSWKDNVLISRWEMLIVCSPSYLLALVMRWAVMGSPLPVSGARPEIRHQFLLSFIIPSAGPNIRTTLVIVTQGIRRKTGEREWHFCQTLLCYLWLKLQRL